MSNILISRSRQERSPCARSGPDIPVRKGPQSARRRARRGGHPPRRRQHAARGHRARAAPMEEEPRRQRPPAGPREEARAEHSGAGTREAARPAGPCCARAAGGPARAAEPPPRPAPPRPCGRCCPAGVRSRDPVCGFPRDGLEYRAEAGSPATQPRSRLRLRGPRASRRLGLLYSP